MGLEQQRAVGCCVLHNFSLLPGCFPGCPRATRLCAGQGYRHTHRRLWALGQGPSTPCCVVSAAVVALQLAKMVKRPVMSIISQQLFNFQNGVSLYVQKHPSLVGTRFGELAHLFPDGIVMGLVDTTTGTAR